MKPSKERKITINENFTFEMSGRIVEKIYDLSESAPTEPIFFVINSTGGSIRALKSIISAINATSCEIITITLGTIASSCGSILFLQGNERIMLKGSEILFHEPKLITGEKSSFEYSELLEELNFLRGNYEFFIREIARVTKLSKQDIAMRIKGRGYLLNTKEAKSIGVATKVINSFTQL